MNFIWSFLFIAYIFPFSVDKYVSVTLSPLSTPTNISSAYSRLRIPESIEDSSTSSSLSESILSTSPSLTSLDDIEEKPLDTTAAKPFVTEPLVNLGTTPPTQHTDSPVKKPLLTPATQTIRLCRLPRVLRLHIKRFR